jgi:hypothetical protein
MKKGMCLAAVMGASLWLCSCVVLPNYYIPEVESRHKLDQGVYRVSVDNRLNEAEVQFCINNFVQYMSYETYDYEKIGASGKMAPSPSGFGFYGLDNYQVTVPGSLRVADLKPIKKWYAEVHAYQ